MGRVDAFHTRTLSRDSVPCAYTAACATGNPAQCPSRICSCRFVASSALPRNQNKSAGGQADVPIDLRPEVRAYIQYFLTEKRDFFERSLSRSTAYLPMIQTIFREQGLPLDLAYKAMIESGFNPRALSRAYALGMWQFMYRTGLLYGLRRNTYIDDRMNPEKSTHAAAQHLNHLYEYFGDWHLVVAAYNCGQGRMDRELQDLNLNALGNHALPRNPQDVHNLWLWSSLQSPVFLVKDVAINLPAYTTP